MTDIERQLEELIIKYTPLIRSTVQKYATRDVNEVEDAYQDICANVWRYIPRSFKPEKGGKLYLYFRHRVIQEAINYRCRKIKKRKERYCQVPDFAAYSDELEIRYELIELANTDRRKAIVKLCIEGYTVTEMARELKMAKKTILKEFEYFKEILNRDLGD